MTIDPNSERKRLVSRRSYLLTTGSVAVASLTGGCVGESEENSGGDDGDPVDEGEEPDYNGWFDDVDAYEETVDARDEDRVDIVVGSDGGLAFGPPAILVDSGTEIVWEWTGDGGQHDVVHVDGTFESELTDEEGHTFEHSFDEPGVYRYVCVPHESSGMKGAIAVEE